MVGGLGWRPPPTDTTSVERGTVPRSSPRVVGRPHLIPLDSPLIGLRTRQPKNIATIVKAAPSQVTFDHHVIICHIFAQPRLPPPRVRE